jgi:hypothetical protein
MRRAIWRVTEGCMDYRKASVTFWVPHTTLENKVKCANNNPNHKPNVPLVTEEKPQFAPFVRTALPHIWGKTGRFTLFFSLISSKRKVKLMRSPICLSVSFLITFEPTGRFLWNSVGRSCHWRWPRRRTF